jgi:fluoroacetyl-CoA thioesterase
LDPSEATGIPLLTVSLMVGLCAQVELLVSDADTASALGSGDVPVLATPRVVALCEEATLRALAAEMQPGQTSVGFRVEITHLVPVSVGSTVVVSASLERIEGKRLVFSITVNDKCGLVAAGRVTRVLVDLETFMEKAR